MGLIDDVKSIAKTVSQIDNIEVYRKVLDLQGEIFEVLEENAKLKKQIRELQEKLSLKNDLVFRDNCYWITDENEKEDGPFCSKCWDAERKLVRMHICPNPEYSECPTCKKPMKRPKANSWEK